MYAKKKTAQSQVTGDLRASRVPTVVDDPGVDVDVDAVSWACSALYTSPVLSQNAAERPMSSMTLMPVYNIQSSVTRVEG